MIPVNQPLITPKDIIAVSSAMKSGWISSSGPILSKFEKKFSKFIGMRYCIAVSSGSAALDIAVKSLNLRKEDEVIMCNFTIISNVLSIIRQCAKPILVDCTLDDWNINIEQLKSKITKKTKAIMISHIYGFPVDMLKVKKISKQFNIPVIEDAAEMLGNKIGKKYCGSFGDVGIFSFYANKHITTGEGGMICTNNKEIFKKAAGLKNLCFGKINRFNHYDIGWNYRMTSMQAALGLSQLNRIKTIIKKKRKIGNYYYENLKNEKKIILQKPQYNNLKNIYWVVGVLLKKSIKIKALKIIQMLKKEKIEAREFFWPINKQDFLKKNSDYKKKFINSEYLSKKGFYLPSGIGISKKDMNYVILKLKNILKKIK
jgi:perosamine synthetase